MNNKIWYEIYLDMKDEGTKTLKICETYLEALEEKIRLSDLYGKNNLFIDKWQDTDNPRIIEFKEVRR